MDPSVCRLHPGVAITGFCPACLRDRLAGLQPPSSADLRRCKSFSYSRSAAAASVVHSQLDPQRRSCDLFRQEQEPVIAVPEEEEEYRRMEAEEPSRKLSSSFGGLLGKKLQQWRRKKTKEPPMPMPEEIMPSRHRQHSFRDLDPASSWDAHAPRSGPMFDRLGPEMMVSMEEEEYMPAAAAIPRSDGQIPVEEDYYYDDDNNAVPGGCAQTRDYYLDSSSSSRRRRSVDRSTTSARNSFSDVINSELPSSRMATNARVSPAMAAEEFYHAHHQSVLVHHHQYRRDWEQNYNDFSGSSGSFGSAFRANKEAVPPANKPNKKGIKGWSIWGLIHKKGSSRTPEADHRSSFSSAAAPAGVGDQQVEGYPWPQLRARGYNGQMLRCNSSISARSSFSGGAAMIGGRARRSISGMELQHDAHGSAGRTRRDELLLERNLSTRSSYSRSGHIDHPMGAGNYQFSRPNHNGVVLTDRRSSKTKPSALPRRSTLGPYSTDPIPRQ